MTHGFVRSVRRVLPALAAALGTACAHSPAQLPAPVAVRPDRGLSVAVATDSAVSGGTLGVLPFRVQGEDKPLSALGFALADLLATDLSRSSRIRLVERARLGEVLREQDLVTRGVVDSATAPQLGRLLRADRMLIGSLDSLPQGGFRIGVRVADAATGLITRALDAQAPLRDILAAEKALAFRLFEQLGVTLTPNERAAVEANKVSSVQALLAYGTGVAAELNGDFRAAQDAFRTAARADPAFRVAADRATSAQAQVTVARGSTALLPGIRGTETPVGTVVDRLNRPIDHITSQLRPHGGVSDPAFPSTVVTVVITVRRP